MRYCLLLIVLSFCFSAGADNSSRNVVGKLTASAKPPIKIMSDQERLTASENLLALNLDAAPDQVVCRKVKVGRDSASKLKVQRCKSRAEFRAEAAERNTRSTAMIDNSKYLEQNRLRLRQIQQRRRKP